MSGSLSTLKNVTRNTFKSSSFSGVFLVDRPGNNNLLENSFELNHISVDVQNSTSNNFYHNSFCPKTNTNCFRHVNYIFPNDMMTDIWDNRSLGTGPRGGNYWDNYTGTDGDHNGIGDMPYIVNGFALDNYPLMVPFVPVPLAIYRRRRKRLKGSTSEPGTTGKECR